MRIIVRIEIRGWRSSTTVIAPRVVTTLRRQGILGFLVTAYLALLPIQFPINEDINFALADICLVFILLLAPGKLKYRQPAWAIWHFALMFVFVMSTFVVALNDGRLDRYVWLNKDMGL